MYLGIFKKIMGILQQYIYNFIYLNSVYIERISLIKSIANYENDKLLNIKALYSDFKCY